MCVGPEVLPVLQTVGTVLGVVSGAKSLLSGSGSQQAPAQVVREAPVQQQQTEVATPAAQEGDSEKIVARQRARANSLLSRAGGAGDLSTADTTSGRAMAKVNLGE